MTTKKVKPEGGTPEMLIELPPLEIGVTEFSLISDNPLISHKWSAKAEQEMLDKHMKKPKQARAAKDPEEDFQATIYRLPDGDYGFPATAFKCAAVSACTHITGVTKTLARGAFHVVADAHDEHHTPLVRLYGNPAMKQDIVRLQGMGHPPDIRHRAVFPSWAVVLKVRYNMRVITAAQMGNLFNTAGFAVGVGDWRPEKEGGGSYGMFHVANTADGPILDELVYTRVDPPLDLKSKLV